MKEPRGGMLAMLILLVLFGLAFGTQPGFAGGKPKAKAPVDSLMVEALDIQETVQGLRDWAQQISRKKAFKGLVSTGSIRGLYKQFEKKLQGKEVAWVIARKDVSRNLTTQAYFIEHNGSRSSGLKDLETTVRCYVQEAIAEFARAAPAGSMVLCIGKIIDIEFFQNFISIGIEARSVPIGSDEIEAWVGTQAKRTQ
ncbi:MAG: hypothetical protein ACR2PI_17880 [Hyphomicrobiaceae bacterium]